MMADENDPRVALVTGGADGIGREIAAVLGRAGHQLVLWDINEQALERTLADFTEQQIAATGSKVDITDVAAVEAALKSLENGNQTPDILINNAGITRDSLLMRLSEQDWDLVLTVNLKAAFMLTKLCLRPMLKKRWGRIINISSVVGIMGNAGQANYAASKAGLIGLTMSAAREVASRNVTVNAIAPGFIDTAMTRNLPESTVEEFKRTIPLGRLGQPADIANAARFLASEDAGYVTGQVLRVDGGMIMG